MIYTVTFNPAIDYIMKLENLKSGETNRSQSEEVFFGGKGINVSHVLNELGVPSIALGFCAGFTGDAIIQSLKDRGIASDFVKLSKGYSRINVKIKADVETEINGQGPDIGQEEIHRLYEKLANIEKDDMLILAGSIPGTLPRTMYEDIMKSLLDKNVRIVVDATGKLLMNVLKYRPFLIKPNIAELEEIFECKMENDAQILQCAKELQEQGAINVLVSMGDRGAMLVDENKAIHRIEAVKGTLVNTVGAGDSMVAGFVAGFMKTRSYSYALRLGTAAATATAFSMDLADKDAINEMMKRICHNKEGIELDAGNMI